MASSRIKPVLLVDEAQEMDPEVLSELRLLSSADFDTIVARLVLASSKHDLYSSGIGSLGSMS